MLEKTQDLHIDEATKLLEKAKSNAWRKKKSPQKTTNWLNIYIKNKFIYKHKVGKPSASQRLYIT